MKTPTYKELKDFCNSLNEEQLQQKVQYWGDGFGGEIKSVDLLNEDYISSEYELEPRSSYADDPDFADAPAVLAKGTIMLNAEPVKSF